MQSLPRKQSGAALVIGLILLLVMTLLGVSGMNTATLELTMTSNDQYGENAFQAAETGIDATLAAGGFTTSGPPMVVPVTVMAGGDTYTTTTTFEGETPIPPRTFGSFSRGVPSGGFSAYHFRIDSTGTSQRNAQSQHAQGAFVIGPGGANVF